MSLQKKKSTKPGGRALAASVKNLEAEIQNDKRNYHSRTESIEILYEKASDYGGEYWNYYASSIGKFRSRSKGLTALMVILLIGGIVLEALHIIYTTKQVESREQQLIEVVAAQDFEKAREIATRPLKEPGNLMTVGFILLVIAYGTLLIDRNFGFSTTYLRYVDAHLKLREIMEDFNYSWQFLTVRLFKLDGSGKIIYPDENDLDNISNDPSKSADISLLEYNELKSLIMTFKNQVDEIVAEETEEWKANWRKSRSELASMITNKYQSFKEDRLKHRQEIMDRVEKIKNNIPAKELNKMIEIDLPNMDQFQTGVVNVLRSDSKHEGGEINIDDSHKSLVIPNLQADTYLIIVEAVDAKGKKSSVSRTVDLTSDLMKSVTITL